MPVAEREKGGAAVMDPKQKIEQILYHYKMLSTQIKVKLSSAKWLGMNPPGLSGIDYRSGLAKSSNKEVYSRLEQCVIEKNSDPELIQMIAARNQVEQALKHLENHHDSYRRIMFVKLKYFSRCQDRLIAERLGCGRTTLHRIKREVLDELYKIGVHNIYIPKLEWNKCGTNVEQKRNKSGTT